ncbi:MAG: hypothetical protein WAZ27_00245 [Minisyncoccia bacterium]
MEIYDPAKIGTRIAWGRSHSVYHYGDDEVIRFPRAERWLKFLLGDELNLHERFRRDISVCEQYLGDYVLTTRVTESSKGEIATIQPHIKGNYLSKEDLQNKAIGAQFQDLVTRYETMLAAGYVVDLIGQGGVFQRRLSNVLVLGDGSLKLFDAGLADMRIVNKAPYITQFAIKLILKRQRSTLRFLLS